MLKLLGRSTSINVRKVLWTLDELGVAFDHTESGGADLKTAAFLALNPNGRVPVIEDGEFVLWESNAICRYLAARERRDDLLPTQPVARAVVEQWMDWQITELDNAWRYAFLSLVRKDPACQDASAVAASVASWNRQMRIVDDRLAKTGAFIAGPTFTLADVVIGLASYRWTMTPIERPALAAVDAWMTRLEQREPYRRHGANGRP
ncbi:MAG: glutathione S-transferase family protein [Burkholderiaceae bacterium]